MELHPVIPVLAGITEFALLSIRLLYFNVSSPYPSSLFRFHFVSFFPVIPCFIKLTMSSFLLLRQLTPRFCLRKAELSSNNQPTTRLSKQTNCFRLACNWWARETKGKSEQTERKNITSQCTQTVAFVRLSCSYLVPTNSSIFVFSPSSRLIFSSCAAEW